MKVKDIVTDFATRMKSIDLNEDTDGEIHSKIKQIDFEILCNLPEDVDLKTYLKTRQICLMDLYADTAKGLVDSKQKKKETEAVYKYIDEVFQV